ncbi:hypothetical protein GBA52_027951 [Prunus armeniaca]|nr:hypothetical protein GBA52_027951 [Prunus armeniaca]
MKSKVRKREKPTLLLKLWQRPSQAQRLRGSEDSETQRLRDSERVLCSRIQALAADFLSRTGTWTSQTTSIITNLKPSMCSLDWS